MTNVTGESYWTLLENSQHSISKAITVVAKQLWRQAGCFSDFVEQMSKQLISLDSLDVDSAPEMKIIQAAVEHLNGCRRSMKILLDRSSDDYLVNAVGSRKSSFSGLDVIMDELIDAGGVLLVVRNGVKQVCKKIGKVNGHECYLDVLMWFAGCLCKVFKYFQAYYLDAECFSAVSYRLGQALAELEKLPPRCDGKEPSTREAASPSDQT